MARNKKSVVKQTTTRSGTTYAALLAGPPAPRVGRAPGNDDAPGPGGAGDDSSSDDGSTTGADGSPDLVEQFPVITLDPTPPPEPKGKGPAAAASKPDVIGDVAAPSRLEAIAIKNATALQSVVVAVTALQAAVFGRGDGSPPRKQPRVEDEPPGADGSQLPPTTIQPPPNAPSGSPGSPATGGTEYGEATTTRVPAPWPSVEWPQPAHPYDPSTGMAFVAPRMGADPFYAFPSNPRLPAGSSQWVIGQPPPLAAIARTDEQLQISGIAAVLPGGTGRTPVEFPAHWVKISSANMWRTFEVNDQFTQQLRIEAAPRPDGKPRKAWQRDLWEYPHHYRCAAHLQLLVLQLHFMRAQLRNSLLGVEHPEFMPIDPQLCNLSFDHVIELALSIYEASIRLVSNIRVRVRDGVGAALLLAKVDVDGQGYVLDPKTRSDMAQLRKDQAQQCFKAAARQPARPGAMRLGRDPRGNRPGGAKKPSDSGGKADQSARRSSPKGGDRQ